MLDQVRVNKIRAVQSEVNGMHEIINSMTPEFFVNIYVDVLVLYKYPEEGYAYYYDVLHKTLFWEDVLIGCRDLRDNFDSLCDRNKDIIKDYAYDILKAYSVIEAAWKEAERIGRYYKTEYSSRSTEFPTEAEVDNILELFPPIYIFDIEECNDFYNEYMK